MLFGLIAVVPWFFTLGFKPLRTRRLGLLSVRGVLNIIAMWAFFICLSLIPLDEATALSFTAPIFATLLAVITFGEVVSARAGLRPGSGSLARLLFSAPGSKRSAPAPCWRSAPPSRVARAWSSSSP